MVAEGWGPQSGLPRGPLDALTDQREVGIQGAPREAARGAPSPRPPWSAPSASQPVKCGDSPLVLFSLNFMEQLH